MVLDTLRTWAPLVALLLFSPSLPGQEWSRFRGPNGSGISRATTIPTGWSSGDYRWRVKLPGIGYSSPVIWGDRVFATSGIEDDGTQIICCLKTSDGGPVWQRSFSSRTYPKNKLNCYAVVTPPVDQSHVYLTWATPEHYFVVALAQQDGREVWRRDLGPFLAQHGFGPSPILFDGMLIVANDQDGPSSIVALDGSTGQQRWKAPRRTEKAGYSTPCIFQPQGAAPQLIITSWAHGFSSLDPQTGKLNWELPVLANRVVGSPIVAAGLIFASAGTGGAGKQMFAVRPGDPAKAVPPEVAYEIKGSLPYVPTPVTDDRLVFLFGDQGVITCIDAASGQLRWRERVEGKFFGSPVRLSDRLYCITRDGQMLVLAAADQFKLLARIDLEEPSNSTPAIADEVMYLRTASHLMALGGKP